MRIYCFFVLFLIEKVTSQELTSMISETITNSTQNNTPAPQVNFTTQMEKITKPSNNFKRTSETTTIYPNSTSESAKSDDKMKEFKPSTQVDEPFHYEYNRFPVVPAIPEPKHLGSVLPEPNTYLPHHTRSENVKWPSKHGIINDLPWRSQPVKFPSGPSGREREFPHSNTHKSNFAKYTTSVSLGSNKYLPDKFPNYGRPWEKEEKTVPYEYQRHPPLHKIPPHDYYESPPISYSNNGGKYDLEEKSHEYISHPVSPWAKIIKILTAIIPIGLLISALTPTVITVTAMNNTQQSLRLRADDPKREAAKRLISSISYFNKLNGQDCEERILCELLLSSSSKTNAEEYVQNLLSNSGQGETNISNSRENLKKIFHAVKKGGCESIVCENSKIEVT